MVRALGRGSCGYIHVEVWGNYDEGSFANYSDPYDSPKPGNQQQELLNRCYSPNPATLYEITVLKGVYSLYKHNGAST